MSATSSNERISSHQPRHTRIPASIYGPFGVELQSKGIVSSYQRCLQGVEHALTQERKFSTAIAHALDQLQLMDLSLDDPIALL